MIFYGVPGLKLRNVKHLLTARCAIQPTHFLPIKIGLCPSPYTFLSRQRYSGHPSQKSFEQRKEITFDRRL